MVRGAGAATWIERTVDEGVTQVRLVADEVAGLGSLPLLSGVTLASSIVICRDVREGHGSEDELGTASPDDCEPSATPSFDHLFGDTVRPVRPELAAISAVLGPAQRVPAPDAKPTEEALGDPTRRSDEGFAPPTVTFEPPDDDEVTVDRAALLRAQGLSLSVGPTVPAVRCVAGHLNPPDADRCRVCPADVPQQESFTAVRPTLGALRLSTGDSVPLDRGVILGRAPRAAEHDESSRPNVVKLASPGHDISRTHLEVRIEGWQVFVVDLDSTNGTSVTLPGETPRTLLANDQALIEPGTVVELADEVTFTFEATS